MIGVPFDGGVANRVGARHGPREIRNIPPEAVAVRPNSLLSPGGVIACTIIYHVVRGARGETGDENCDIYRLGRLPGPLIVEG